MKKKYISILITILLFVVNVSIATANNDELKSFKTTNAAINGVDNNYGIQWEMNFGSDDDYGGRFEGPQPIGDCDNDGKNEMLIAGRDGKIRVFEWNEKKQTYLEMHTLFCPLYPKYDSDAGGFAIGDLTGDGKNEIGATWGTSVHKFIGNKYRTIGYNSYVFKNDGGSADCYIGDYDNDGQNELLVSGGPFNPSSPVPEIVIFKMTALGLVREAEWDAPGSGYTYIYMPSIGDVDYDGENEIVCGSFGRVYVLDWNKNTNTFDQQIIREDDNYPFACVLKDSDMDGKVEIHIGYYFPYFCIMEWNGADYELKFEAEWPDEAIIIEAVDVGDVDNDGINEVCVGTDLVHILQWDGETYVEEAVLPTFGDLAVVSVGDCDNDGIDEINVGAVFVEHGQDYMSWVYKYNYNPVNKPMTGQQFGNLKVQVKTSLLGNPLENASVAAWNQDTKVWYDIQPRNNDFSVCKRNFLPVGQYILRVHVEGFENKETNIEIKNGEETTHTFELRHSFARSSYPHNMPNLIDRLFDVFPNLQMILKLLF